MARIEFKNTLNIPHKKSYKILWYKKHILIALWGLQTAITVYWMANYG